MLKMIRLPALLAAVCFAAATALAQPANPPAPPAPPPPRRAAAPAAAPAAAAAPAPARSGREEGDRSRRQPVRPRGAVEGRRLGRQDHAGHPRHHVDGQLVHHHHQGLRAVQDGRAGAGRRTRRSGRRRRCSRAPRAEEDAARSASSPSPGSRRPASTTGLLGNVDLNDWITMSIQRAIDNVQSRTQDGLAFLATVGSTAPFVGLFGTVWGIYHALTAIGIAGQASIDKVAGPVGEALIMTAIGLAVAVPGGARLQLARPPQQGGDGARPRLRRRPARRAAVRAEVARAKALTPWR